MKHVPHIKSRSSMWRISWALAIVAVWSHQIGPDYGLRSKSGKDELRRFYAYARQQYPLAQELYGILDCWPVHFLSSVCATTLAHGITLVALPTYASWRNPIEKLWRWLKRSILHIHLWADDWQGLKEAVIAFPDRFHAPHLALLRYIVYRFDFSTINIVSLFAGSDCEYQAIRHNTSQPGRLRSKTRVCGLW
jgi:hypothetical protein